jgi:hypothetical protein
MLEESEQREREEGITPGEDRCIMELHVEGVLAIVSSWGGQHVVRSRLDT